MPTGEQPRCQTCGHRRIFHSLLIGNGHAGPRRIEIMVPCSLRDCTCPEYTPARSLRTGPQRRFEPVDHYLPAQAGDP